MKARDELAFTLIEVIMALSMFLILISIVLPSFNNYLNYIGLVTATNNLASDLQWTRQKAIKDREEYGVLFFPDKLKYQVVKEDGYQVIKEVGLKEKGIKLKNITFPSKGGGYAVFFKSLGNISGVNGGVTLVNESGRGRRIKFSSNAGELNICWE